MDPITRQVLAGALRSICDEMGAVLVRAAHSPNIKERRDCSTALFDPAGELVMQAEHIPVHLGSMPSAVAAVLGRELPAGGSWVLNDPYEGGTHLPDITLITPVHGPGGAPLIGYAATRAHHADVGGRTPGSMPPDSRLLDEEGVVIPPTPFTAIADLGSLVGAMRNPGQRLADLRAQWAANELGAERLAGMLEQYGVDGLATGMSAALDYAERRTRARLAELPDGSWQADDVLEGGPDGLEDIRLHLVAQIHGDSLTLDFSGSSSQVGGNLNCPLTVTRAASLFAVRALIDPDAPPSAGGHRPVDVIAPRGSILNARSPAAVVAGNVETSSRIADLVLEALGEPAGGPAQGQGTMNNLTLGNEDFTYYETLAGGQGACADAEGPSAVHVTMSNTLNTPVEALEAELPLRVRELSVRRGSGGDGRHRGGDGIVRELVALAPMSFSLITERRRHAPRGRAGGADGAMGCNILNGEPIAAKVSGELQPGDRLRMETPGGGGFGA